MAKKFAELEAKLKAKMLSAIALTDTKCMPCL